MARMATDSAVTEQVNEWSAIFPAWFVNEFCFLAEICHGIQLMEFDRCDLSLDFQVKY